MNSKELRAYEKAERAAQAARKKLMERTRSELVDLLKAARKETVVILAGAPTEYEQWRATALQGEIDRVLGELASKSGNVISAAAGEAWTGGVAAVEVPMSAIGLDLPVVHLDTRQLMAMRNFYVERIKDISVVAASKIRRELGLAMLGSQPLSVTIANVGKALDEPSVSRATTIVRDALSTAWSSASDERARESAAAGVEMEKIWRRSGKIHSRLTHDLADGQRVAVDKPFKVGGVDIMYPHDPAAPVGETANCGCIALYRPKDSKSRLPDKRPFTREELSANPYKADLASYRSGKS